MAPPLEPGSHVLVLVLVEAIEPHVVGHSLSQLDQLSDTMASTGQGVVAGHCSVSFKFASGGQVAPPLEPGLHVLVLVLVEAPRPHVVGHSLSQLDHPDT